MYSRFKSIVAALTPVVPKHVLSFAPKELWAPLEQAALEYAVMSPADFRKGVLYVGSTRLREVGLIDAATWVRVPANDNIRVTKQPDGTMIAKVLLAG